MPLCECGCGVLVKNRFFRGHNARKEHPTLGKKASAETILKLKESHRGLPSNRKGETHTPESIEKMRIAKIGKKATDKTKKKMSKSMKGKKCSLQTKSKIRKTKIGEKNPRWKGGITPSRKLLRQSLYYKEWRRNVFARDNFTCQSCGVKDKTIQAHHVYPVSAIIKDNIESILGMDFSVEILSEIDNGITLCRKCHIETHRLEKLKHRLEKLKIA